MALSPSRGVGQCLKVYDVRNLSGTRMYVPHSLVLASGQRGGNIAQVATRTITLDYCFGVLYPFLLGFSNCALTHVLF